MKLEIKNAIILIYNCESLELPASDGASYGATVYGLWLRSTKSANLAYHENARLQILQNATNSMTVRQAWTVYRQIDAR